MLQSLRRSIETRRWRNTANRAVWVQSLFWSTHEATFKRQSILRLLLYLNQIILRFFRPLSFFSAIDLLVNNSAGATHDNRLLLTNLGTLSSSFLNQLSLGKPQRFDGLIEDGDWIHLTDILRTRASIWFVTWRCWSESNVSVQRP